MLVAALRAGDATAFRSLYERHAPAVAMAVRDRVRCEDMVQALVQETFTRALERLGTLRGPACVRPWLLAIARNLAADRSQLEQRQMAAVPEDLDEADVAVAAVEEAAVRGELAELVGRCLAGLSPRDATALALVTHLDLGPADVADALGISRGAAKVAIHRARRRLRTSLAIHAIEQEPTLACGDFPRGEGGDPARHVDGCDGCVAGARSALLGTRSAAA